LQPAKVSRPASTARSATSSAASAYCSTDSRVTGETELLKNAASFSSAESDNEGWPATPKRSRRALSYCSRVKRRNGA
jgi:hypothetical protein